jgi:hypothetical protein
MTSFTLYNPKADVNKEFAVKFETYTPLGDGTVRLNRMSPAIRKIKAGIYKDWEGNWPEVRILTLEDAREVYRVQRALGWLTAEEITGDAKVTK